MPAPMRLAERGNPMKNFWSILIAYLAAWAIFFGYYASVGRRLTRLEAELRRLKEQAAKD